MDTPCQNGVLNGRGDYSSAFEVRIMFDTDPVDKENIFYALSDPAEAFCAQSFGAR